MSINGNSVHLDGDAGGDLRGWQRKPMPAPPASGSAGQQHFRGILPIADRFLRQQPRAPRRFRAVATGPVAVLIVTATILVVIACLSMRRSVALSSALDLSSSRAAAASLDPLRGPLPTSMFPTSSVNLPEHLRWCRWNNAFNWPVAAPNRVSPSSLHFGDAWLSGCGAEAIRRRLHLVVVVLASELLLLTDPPAAQRDGNEHEQELPPAIAWLQHVPFPTTLVVKVDMEVVDENASGKSEVIGDGASPLRVRKRPGYRAALPRLPPFDRVHHTADLLQSLKAVDDGGMHHHATNGPATLSSVRHGQRRWDAAVAALGDRMLQHFATAWNVTEGGSPPRTVALSPNDSRLQGAITRVTDLLLRKRRSHGLPRDCFINSTSAANTIDVIVQPNLGDEALGYAAAALRILNRSAAAEAAPPPPPVDFVALLHAHRESWHSLDVVDQLRCLELDPAVRRYVTLTSPSRSFMYQCMVYRDGGAATEAAGEELRRAPLESSAGGDAEWHRMQQRQALIAAATQRNHALAAQLLLSGNEGDGRSGKVRTSERGGFAVARDCCASMIVSFQALREAETVLRRFERVLRLQPAQRPVREGDSTPVVFEELSMYAERLWRHVFRPSVADVSRDLSVVGCGRGMSHRRSLRRAVAACDGQPIAEHDTNTTAADASIATDYVPWPIGDSTHWCGMQSRSNPFAL